MNSPELTFLKLGGSLITDKDSPRTPRYAVIQRLCAEIAQARSQRPELRLVIGHGSGSFGHVVARKYDTRQGVHSPEEWTGFAEVWKEARALNQIIVDALVEAGLPVIAFPPSAAVLAQDGEPVHWDIAPLRAALLAGLIPLINGDTIFDEQRGGTILSTEDLFHFLAGPLSPRRILLAGREEGVWADFPSCTRLVNGITPENYAQLVASIGGSASVDVTGGMLEKVHSMLELAKHQPGFRAQIFSGLVPGNVRQALVTNTVAGISSGSVIYQPG